MEMEKWELRNAGRRMLNLEKFISESEVFNISVVERKLLIPKTTLQKHIKRQRPLPTHYLFKLEEYFKKYGYDINNKYYKDTNIALCPIKFLNM